MFQKQALAFREEKYVIKEVPANSLESWPQPYICAAKQIVEGIKDIPTVASLYIAYHSYHSLFQPYFTITGGTEVGDTLMALKPIVDTALRDNSIISEEGPSENIHWHFDHPSIKLPLAKGTVQFFDRAEYEHYLLSKGE